ncbi:hypothetical protein BDW22DRAFT_709989 [Trametopsis cervina]|nr:hypothetical protein BDW22DRAFT_709989 [Trametopsis cervina]
MFRSATTRIAHNSTLPSLSTLNKDLKALQELINAEKSVMQTLQKLSLDMAKAAECLKNWGQSEGDDLGDTLTASTSVLLHYASALSRFSSHEGAVREQMKSVRTREENLDEVKRRRKSLAGKAEAADKKLTKMSAENKNFQSQADSLNKLREEIRALDTEIMNEEASLGDFKRTTAKYWMGIKFGALMECSEKGMIVGEIGKLAIGEIPLTPTEPGLPRPYYQGHARTEFLVAEAQRAISDVVFSTEPNQQPHSLSIRPLPGNELPPVPGQISFTNSIATGSTGTSSPSVTEAPSDIYNNRLSQAYMSPNLQFTSLPPVRSDTKESLGMQQYLGNGQQPPSPPISPPPQSSYSAGPYAPPPGPPPAEVNEFGAYPGTSTTQFSPRSTSLRNLSGVDTSQQPSSVGGPRGPRFATFPTKVAAALPSHFQNVPPQSPSAFSAPLGLGDRGPSLDLERRDSVSFSSSVAQALGQDFLAQGQDSPGRVPPSTSKLRDVSGSTQDQWAQPPPRYSITPDPPSGSDLKSTAGAHPEPPEEEDTHLAYAASDAEDRASRSSVQIGGHGSRHVRFGDASQEEAGPQGQSTIQDLNEHHEEMVAPFDRAGPSYQPNHPVNQTTTPPHSPRNEAQGSAASPYSPTQYELAPQPVAPHFPEPEHVAPPAPMTKEEEEKAANAAAAREVSRELDALMFSSPLGPPRSADAPPPQPPSSPPASISSRGRPSLGGDAPASPATSASAEPVYVRQRNRGSSIPGSTQSRSDQDHDGRSIQSQPPVSDGLIAQDYGAPQSLPPPHISLRGSFPAQSFASTETPYRTPSEFPLPPPPSFYNLPSASASGGLSPGGGRTVSAAIFKRQLRAPSSPPPADASQGQSEVSPLVIAKRGLPGNPRPGPRLEPPNASGMQRVSSAPSPVGPGPDGQPDPRYRSVSGAARPLSVARPGEQVEDDEYDYISAYVDSYSAHSPDTQHPPPSSAGGYDQGRFATNLEQEQSR